MPENEVKDAQAPEAAPVTETKAQKFERERYTRRQALRKMGMTTAMATFAMFSVDDLARMVSAALQQRAGDSQVAEQAAHEFQQAGIVLADVLSYYPNGKHCACNQKCSGLCECLCEFDKCVALRQLCAKYPHCCNSVCQPVGSLACGSYSKQVGTIDDTYKDCLLNPGNHGHADCDDGN